MKALKIILGILAVLVIAIGLFIFFAFSKLDDFVKSTMESIGTEVLNTQVSIDDVSLKLTKGRGEIEGVTIKNPPGFSEPNIFTLGHIALQIEPASLARDVYVIDELTIDGVDLTVEHKGLTDTNVQTILNNIKSKSKSSTSEASSTTGPEPLFAVKQLNFVNTQMKIVSPQFDTRTLAIKDIQQTNIGSADNGLTSKELAMAVAKPLLDEAQNKFEDELKDKAGDEISKKLKEKLSDKDKEKLDKVRSMLGQ